MSEETLRDLGGRPSQPDVKKKGRNVVAVIGIDSYLHNQILTNAVSDARGIRDLFTKQLDFIEITPPLFNEQATLPAIMSMVQDVLSYGLEDNDSLVLFFAGHGYTESRRVGNQKVKTGYLIPVEGRNPAEKKFSSYMKIDSFLQDVSKLPARHVLVILDACDSGFALGDATKDRGVDRYVEEMGNRMSRRVITSALDGQPALDGGPIPEHSLFTGTLIEALAMAKADEEKKGFVTGSELGMHLQQTVAMHTSSKQTPDFGAFELDDRGDLVISLVGEAHNRRLAQESLQAGMHGMELGAFTHEPQRYRFAASQFRTAIRYAHLARMDLPDAETGLASAFWMAGETYEAEKALREVLQRGATTFPVEGWFWLGMCHARMQDYSQAADFFRRYLGSVPEPQYAGWVRQYLEWIERISERDSRNLHALLVGINEYQADSLVALQGCVNDIERLVKPVLEEKFHLRKENCRVLLNQFGTQRRIKNAFEKLKNNSTASDTIVVYFSGHSIPTDDRLFRGWNDNDIYLLFHDTEEKQGRYLRGLSPGEFHRMMKDIPAVNKTLILDTHASRVMVDLAEQEGDYNLILASDTAEVANEWKVKVGDEEIPCGMLSGALYLTLWQVENLRSFTYQEWVNNAVQITQKASTEGSYHRVQTPLFIGEGNQIVFAGSDPFLDAFEFSRRKTWHELTSQQLKRWYHRFSDQFQIHNPDVYLAFGKAFRTKGSFRLALEALNKGIQLDPDGVPQFYRELSYTETLMGDADNARQHWSAFSLSTGVDQKELIEHLTVAMEKFQGVRPLVKIFLLNIPRTALEAKVSYDIDLQLEEIKKGKFSWEIDRLKKIMDAKFGQDGFDLQVFPLEDFMPNQTRDFRETLRLIDVPANQPAIICFLGTLAFPADLVNISQQFIEKLSEGLKTWVEGKPIVVWFQSDPARSNTELR